MALGQCYICGTTKNPQTVVGAVIKGEVREVCLYHRDHPNEKVERTKEDEKVKEQKAVKKGLKTFYDKMLDKAPEYCQSGSGERLTLSGAPNKRTIVCHILDKAKSQFPYLAQIPENIVYLNWQPHTDFDRTKKSKAPAEPLYSTCREQFKKFCHLVRPADMHKVPFWLNEGIVKEDKN